MSHDLVLKKTNRNYARGGSFKLNAPIKPYVPTPAAKSTAFKIAKNMGQRNKKPGFVIAVPRSAYFRGESVGEEEWELACYGGSTEKEALLRRMGRMGENFRDADMEDDGDEEQPTGSKAKIKKATNATNESLTKTATSASQMMAVTAAASRLSRLAKRRR
jgi:hypothetical protein